MSGSRAVRALLDERPDLESGLNAVLVPEEPWSFDDVDVDTGRFGELVAHGIVEETEGGYCVVDRAAVEQALRGDTPPSSATVDVSVGWVTRFVPFQGVSRRELGFLVGALFLVFVFRTIFSYQNVFQGGYVVLSGNDPYYYRYWVELLLTDPEMTLSTLPNTVLLGEPLMVATLWFATVLLGGTTEMAGFVLAWYPVVAAVVTGVLVYVTTVVLTRDRRVGLAAVAMLAVLPGHAFRTSLGFADHHAFDYPWVVLSLLGVVLVTVAARREPSKQPPALDDEAITGFLPDTRTVAGIFAVAVGVTGQVLAWENGPLLIVPLGLWFAVEALRSVHVDESPYSTTGPVFVGVALAATATWFVHESLGWHTTLVSYSPALLAVGAFGVVVAAQVASRLDVPAPALAITELVGLAGGAYALATFWPAYWTALTSSMEGRLFARRAIAEVQGLFSDSIGWLLLFGFLLLFGLPYLVWATNRVRTDGDWLPAVVYGWAFFALSVVQIRFVGEFSPIFAIFCGLGFVHLAAWVDAAELPGPFTDTGPDTLRVPRAREFRVLVALFLLVASLSIVQIPVKTSQVTISQDQFEVTEWMMDHESNLNRTYPENYVFSRWGYSRLYNYFVNGQSRSYGYAQSNWAAFVASENGTEWYHRFKDRTGYLVVSNRDAFGETPIGARLFRHYGSRNGDVPGLAHYRVRYVAGTYRVFTLTSGAVIAGHTDANATVRLSTNVAVPGAEFEYVRQTNASASGNYSVRVPYPGTYIVVNETVTVTERDVTNGTTVQV